MSTVFIVVATLLSFIYLVLGVAIAVEYPSKGEMPKTRFRRFLFRIVLITTWLPIVGLHLFNKAFGWLFS